jgi:hypothetical protein
VRGELKGLVAVGEVVVIREYSRSTKLPALYALSDRVVEDGYWHPSSHP